MVYRNFLKRDYAGKLVIPRSTYYRWQRRKMLMRNSNAQPHAKSKNNGATQSTSSPNWHFYSSSLHESSADATPASGVPPHQQQLPYHYPHNENMKLKEKQNQLFEGSRINAAESRILILSYVIKHKLSNVALGDLLGLVNFHLPTGCNIATSIYLLEKELGEAYSEVKKHFYCANPKCESGVKEDSGRFICTDCNARIKTSSENYFICFDGKAILKNLLEHPLVKSNLVKNCEKRGGEKDGVIRDIVDGAMYRLLGLENYDLSCCMNSDGVKLFNKSKFSGWPILLSLNELDYPLRRKHTVLAGLWFGFTKPNFSLFMKPFVKQCCELTTVGIQWSYREKNLTSKVIFPMLAADSGARYDIQGINAHTGKCSCNWCTIRGGLTVRVDGHWVMHSTLDKNAKNQKKWRERKFIFDPKEDAELRTEAQFLSNLEQLQESSHTKKEVCGVKKPSPLLWMPKFNIVNGFVFDYMHTVLLGVLKTFTEEYFASKNHRERYYLGRKECRLKINKRISQCKIPNDCTRTLRGIDDMPYWKANEWKQWFQLCIPILHGVLPEVYLQHFAKFINAISLLLQNAITEEDIILSERLIHEFQDAVPKLYGKQFCLFNVHILQHAPECVRNWGPLWAYSLFQFENFNGLIKKSFSGTRYVGLQICKRVLRVQKVLAMGEMVITNPIVKNFYLSLCTSRVYYKTTKKMGVATFCGPNKVYTFSNTEIQKLQKYGFQATQGYSYGTCIVRGKLFRTAKRDTNFRCNSIAEIEQNFYIIKEIIAIQGDLNGYVFCHRLLVSRDKYSIGYNVSNVSNVLVIFLANQISMKKFFCRMEGDKPVFISELINSIERE